MLISPEYREISRRMHQTKVKYGTTGGESFKYAERFWQLTGRGSILDYGAGKGSMASAWLEKGIVIAEYDPGMPGKDAIPEPADYVICTDVLEHIEPECLEAVLDDLRRVTLRSIFATIHLGPALKHLPDGRNAHLTQQPPNWWLPKIMARFSIIFVSMSQDRQGLMVAAER